MKKNIIIGCLVLIIFVISIIAFSPFDLFKKEVNNDEKKNNLNSLNLDNFVVYSYKADDIECLTVITDIELKDGYYYTVNDGCSIPYIKFDGKLDITLKDALDKNLVTIKDLLDKDIQIHKGKENATNPNLSSKNFTVYIERPSDMMCASVMTDIELKDGYYYTVGDSCSTPYIEIDNNPGIPLKEALDKNLVTIQELLDKDIQIHK